MADQPAPECPVVTVHDPATGETERKELPADEYIVICGERREISYFQHFANGTVQLTIRLLRQ